MTSSTIKNWTLFLVAQVILIGLVTTIVAFHKDKAAITKLPPASLSQWYKPENKRQVWLHNMFKLRREMQAVQTYASQKDEERLTKWATQFQTNYLKIAKMVPEWKKRLDMQALDQLQAQVTKQQYDAIPETMERINESCESCHSVYQATVATLYRAPDFSHLNVQPDVSFRDHMQSLIEQINQIKIAIDDHIPETAQNALSQLSAGMDSLGATCASCHTLTPQTYPNPAIKQSVQKLERLLTSGSAKDQGKELGTLAVIACAQCHGTHRLSYAMRQQFTDRPTWHELIKH